MGANKNTVVSQVNRKLGYTSIDVSYIDQTQGSYMFMDGLWLAFYIQIDIVWLLKSKYKNVN